MQGTKLTKNELIELLKRPNQQLKMVSCLSEDGKKQITHPFLGTTRKVKSVRTKDFSLETPTRDGKIQESWMSYPKAGGAVASNPRNLTLTVNDLTITYELSVI